MIGNYFFSSSGAAAYEIEQSLRFDDNDSAHLSRTPSSAGNRQIWTYSGWIKRGRVGFRQQLLNSTSGAYIEFVADNTIRLEEYTGSVQWTLKTNAVYRDNSAWYHIVVAFNSTESTSSNRIKLWINNEQVTSFSGSTYPALNHNSQMNTTSEHRIGEYYTGSSDYFDGYLAEVNFIDGSALTPTDFGEYDDNGVWRPIKYAGSYTGQSWYLKFASGDGTDSSGLSNTWTASGFTTSGTGTDVMSDTPTTNWCTFNPTYVSQNNSGNQFSEGNLKYVSSGTAWRTNVPTFGSISSGKWYWEWSVNTVDAYCGIIGEDVDTIGSGNTQSQAGTILYYGSGQKRIDNVGSSYGSSYNGGGSDWDPVVGIALDKDNNTITFYRNGVSQGAINLSSSSVDLVNKPVRPAFLIYDGTSYGNFGQFAFQHTPPTGFKALNTANLPAPDIADGSQYFNTVLYTGNGSNSHAITGVGFQPDLVWIKDRNVTGHDHVLTDAVRGNTKVLRSNVTNSEYTQTDAITSFDSDGFTLGDDNSVGEAGNFNSSNAHVAWNWLAGNGTSSNTAGTITSTVSANPTAGFSIVSYTGNGTSGATVGHGLGVAPSMIITKVRSGTGSWPVYHSTQGAGKYGYLDTTGAFASSTGFYGGVEPTSTVYTIGNNARVNSNGNTYIAYCFAEVEGYSKFGRYTGNGSSQGPFIHCGFRPSWVIIKSGNIAGKWIIQDTTRNPYNRQENILCAEDTRSESAFASIGATGWIDSLSNGFKIRDSWSDYNSNGNQFIFAAFAEHPFGGDGVSPATAR